MYREMDMSFWLAQADAERQQLHRPTARAGVSALHARRGERV